MRKSEACWGRGVGGLSVLKGRGGEGSPEGEASCSRLMSDWHLGLMELALGHTAISTDGHVGR